MENKTVLLQKTKEKIFETRARLGGEFLGLTKSLIYMRKNK